MPSDSLRSSSATTLVIRVARCELRPSPASASRPPPVSAPITTAPVNTPVMSSTVQQLDHCADSLRTGQVLPRLVASGVIASLVPSDSLRSSSALPLRVRFTRCGLRCHRLPHYPVHLCPGYCSRLRQCARHDRLHYLPHSPPLSRRGGSPPPGPPASVPLRLCPWFLRSRPPARALVLTPHAPPMLVAPFAPLACGILRTRRLWTPCSCWTEWLLRVTRQPLQYRATLATAVATVTRSLHGRCTNTMPRSTIVTRLSSPPLAHFRADPHGKSSPVAAAASLLNRTTGERNRFEFAMNSPIW